MRAGDSSGLLPLLNPSQESQVLFAANQLSWQVGGQAILKQLDIEIPKKSMVGVIGPNGAGKSSFLNCLYRRVEITSGKLSFYQKPIESYSRRRLAKQIAVLQQEPSYQFDLRVEEVVAMGLIPKSSLFSIYTPNDEKAIAQALNDVGLADKSKRVFNHLSGGEKQRVLIARALVQQAEVLILDEPTNHLDIAHQIEAISLIKNMKLSVIMSLHDLNLAAAFCDQLILLDRGGLVIQGTPEQVLTREHLKQVFNVEAKISPSVFKQQLNICYNLKPSQAEVNNDFSRVKNNIQEEGNQ